MSTQEPLATVNMKVINIYVTLRTVDCIAHTNARQNKHMANPLEDSGNKLLSNGHIRHKYNKLYVGGKVRFRQNKCCCRGAKTHRNSLVV